MKELEVEKTYYEPLTLEKFEEFCKQIEDVQIEDAQRKERKFVLGVFATKAFMEELSDEEFLAICHTSYIQCGQEAADYIYERYNKLTGKNKK